MKPMHYIVLLNILANTIGLHAGRGGSNNRRHGLTFPTAIVHRFLKNKKATRGRCILLESELEFAKMQVGSENTGNVSERKKALAEKRVAEAKEAEKKATEFIHMLDKQIDEKAAEILAAMDQLALENLKNLDLEGLD